MPNPSLGLFIRLPLKQLQSNWRRSREKQQQKKKKRKRIKALENRVYKDSLNELVLFSLVKESQKAL